VTASASDNVGAAGVQFKLDGVNLGAEKTTTPYTISGSPFEGLRWRSDPSLKLNWIWLENYSPERPRRGPVEHQVRSRRRSEEPRWVSCTLDWYLRGG
jgi:hypothetical protein